VKRPNAQYQIAIPKYQIPFFKKLEKTQIYPYAAVLRQFKAFIYIFLIIL
jgi:hypothetical protein